MRIVIIIAVVAGLCQSKTRFEVASVKPSPTPATHMACVMNDSTVDLGAIPLKILIQIAYRMEPYQISAPDWLATARFDILARPPTGSNKAQIPEMLQALLVERFGLVAHREPKEQQIYALIAGKDGPKLKEGAADNSHSDMAKFLDGRRLLSKINTEDGFWTMTQLDEHRFFDAPRITTPELARTLKDFVDDPVVDMTGLTGAYQVSLELPTVRQMRAAQNASPATAGVASDPDGGVSVFASLQKLGLALEHRKAPVEHIVVDRVIGPLDPGLDQAAVGALSKWHFRAGSRDGAQVSVQMRVEMSFRAL
jgi:uncharacterized protein (TIGR03435 family)